MILCPKCQTPLFFDFDGNPQVGDSAADTHTAIETNLAIETNSATDANSELSFENNFINETVEPEIENLNMNEQPNQGNEDAVSYGNEADKSFTEEVIEDANLQEPSTFESSDEFNLDAPLHSFHESTSLNKNSNLDISNENSETIGQLLYDIEINGIDGSKLRNELYEELKDPRWGWLAIELMGTIKMGQLILKDINAVKASLLVNRLKALPLEIKWKQNV
jgi:hypothetical protein